MQLLNRMGGALEILRNQIERGEFNSANQYLSAVAQQP